MIARESQPNRVFDVLTRGTFRPWVATLGGLVLGSLVLVIGFRPRQFDTFSLLVDIAGALMLMLGPLALGILGMVTVKREINSERLGMLRLTPLPDREILQGFVLTTLFRARFLVALLVSSAPLLYLNYYLDLLRWAIQDCLTLGPFGWGIAENILSGSGCVSPSDPRLIASALQTILPLPVAVLGCILASTTIGVAGSLASQKQPRWYFIPVTTGLLFLVGPVLFYLAFVMFDPHLVLTTCRVIFDCNHYVVRPYLTPETVMSTVAPYVPVWLMLWSPRVKFRP